MNLLILGATSAIAEAVARIYASRGARLVLVGRDGERLSLIAQDLAVRGSANVTCIEQDLAALDSLPALIERVDAAFDGIDVALIAHGVLPDQARCETSASAFVEQFRVNAESPIVLMTALAACMSRRRRGTIVAISSVAGDRGRQSNYAYGSAKAALSAFASGLGQRLAKQGVQVLTVKPGFVDTPMTKDFAKGALWAQPADIAAGIVHAVERRRPVAYLPWFWRWIMLVIRHIPEFVFRKMRL
jgi:short-subunit dehydrogenase